MTTGQEFLQKLQDEALAEHLREPKVKDRNFHYRLRTWVDDNSQAARVLRALDEE